MRVVVVSPRFPPDVGGLEAYVGRLAETLHAEPDCEVTVIATARSWRTRTETYRGITVIRLSTWGTVSNTPVNPWWPVRLRRLLRRLDPDVVSAHAPVPVLADIATWVSPVPVVLTYHSGSLAKGRRGVDLLLGAYERHVLPRVFARCARLVAVSPVALSYATGRAELVPPGVDSARFRPRTPAECRSSRLLYVGRVERTSRWKGLDVLVDSLVRLRALVPEVALDMVGDGDDVHDLQVRAKRLGVDDLITWHGAVDHEHLPAFYDRAAVTVLPSLTESESFGMTLVEAMAAGCPVVGSAVGGIPHVIRDGVDGLLVPPGDPAALADAVATLMLDPALRRDLGAAGRQAAETRWDWEHQERRMVSVLREAGLVA